jgi:hypothetical protein
VQNSIRLAKRGAEYCVGNASDCALVRMLIFALGGRYPSTIPVAVESFTATLRGTSALLPKLARRPAGMTSPSANKFSGQNKKFIAQNRR